MGFSSASECKTKDEKEDVVGRGKELPVWVITEHIFGMSLDHFIVAPLFLHKCSAVKRLAYDFGQLALSAYPVNFIICKMIFKGCPVVVLQRATEGSISRLLLLTL